MNNTTSRTLWLAGTIALALLLPLRLHAQSAVVQRGYDPGVTGADLTETTLNTTNVTPSTFGLLYTLPVDDAIFAQPLYVPKVSINGALHNVLYVATMNDTVYAFDADSPGAPLWTTNLAALIGAKTVPIADFVFSGDKGIVGDLGILSTPVIDLSTNTMYVVTCTQEDVTSSNPKGTMVYRLFALDITTGTPRSGSGVEITGTYDGATFNAPYLLQRMSLVLSGNEVVIGFSAMQLESSGTYSGWVMAYDKSSLTQTGVFATVPTGSGGGGVWQSGRPPVVDSAGDIYLFSANGFGDGYDGVSNFGDSVLKLDPGNGMKLLDWFTPSDWATLDAQDLDLGSSGPMLIPGTNLIAGGGKTGELYLLDTANLGKYTSNDSQVVQKMSATPSGTGFRGGPVYWQRSAANGGPLMYNWGGSDSLKAFAFNGSTFDTTPVAKGPEANQIYPGGILTLSANGDAAGSGIVWATTAQSGDAENNPPVPGELHAYDAANVSQELWNSDMDATRDDFGNLAKFVPPLVANGKVYIATWSDQVAVYGLLGGAGTPDFDVSAGPATQDAAPGDSLSYTVDLAAINGFSSPVTLGVSGLPSGVTASITPSTISGSGSATVQVTVPSGTTLGSYPLTLTGTSGTMLHSAAVTLDVAAGITPSVDGQAYADTGTAAGTITASGLTTYAPNELLLAFVATDYLGSSTGANTTVTGVTGGGLAWSLVQRTNKESGSSEIWSAFAPAPLSNESVTATLSHSVVASMYVASFNGVDPATPVGATGSASANSGAPTGSLVSTRANSLVLAVGNDYDNAINRTLGPGQSILHEYLTPTGDTYWMQRLDAPVTASGVTATINDTAPTSDRYNLSLVEVQPPLSNTSTYSISGALTPSSLTAGSTVSLTGDATGTATADASGNFSFGNLPDGSYVLTPSQANVTFSPASQSVTVNGGDVTGVSFAATSTPSTYSISGALTPSSLTAGSTVSLTGDATGTATADASGNFSFSNLLDGSYVLTPSQANVTFSPASQSVTVNGGNVTGVSFAATSSGGSSGSAVAVDATASHDNGSGSKTISVSGFSTATGNELLLAFVSADYISGSNTTVTAVSGDGLTWTLVARANKRSGTSEIWRAFAPAALSSQTITATLSHSVVASMTVMSFTGVDTSSTDGANAIGAVATASQASGAPTASLVTTRAGSLVVGVGNDYDNAILRTVGSGQTAVHQDLSPTGDTYWVQMTSSPVATSGTTVTINDTSPTGDQYNLAIAEVRGP